MGRLLHTRCSASCGSHGVLFLKPKLPRMHQFNINRSISERGPGNLPRVSLPEAQRDLRGLKNRYMSVPGTHEVFGSKFLTLRVWDKLEKISKEKVVYQNKWGFPTILAVLLFASAVVLFPGLDTQQEHTEAVSELKGSVGKAVTGIRNLAVVINEYEAKVRYLEAKKEGKRA